MQIGSHLWIPSRYQVHPGSKQQAPLASQGPQKLGTTSLKSKSDGKLIQSSPKMCVAGCLMLYAPFDPNGPRFCGCTGKAPRAEEGMGGGLAPVGLLEHRRVGGNFMDVHAFPGSTFHSF